MASEASSAGCKQCESGPVPVRGVLSEAPSRAVKHCTVPGSGFWILPRGDQEDRQERLSRGGTGSGSVWKALGTQGASRSPCRVQVSVPKQTLPPAMLLLGGCTLISPVTTLFPGARVQGPGKESCLPRAGQLVQAEWDICSRTLSLLCWVGWGGWNHSARGELSAETPASPGRVQAWFPAPGLLLLWSCGQQAASGQGASCPLVPGTELLARGLSPQLCRNRRWPCLEGSSCLREPGQAEPVILRGQET